MRRLAATLLSLCLLLTAAPALAKSKRRMDEQHARAAALIKQAWETRARFVRQGVKPLSDRAREDQRRREQQFIQAALRNECKDKGAETTLCLDAVRARLRGMKPVSSSASSASSVSSPGSSSSGGSSQPGN